MYYINAENLLKAMSKPELVQLANDEPRATEPDMAVADGRELFYYNVFTNTLRVDGQDVLSQMRKNIGA